MTSLRHRFQSSARAIPIAAALLAVMTYAISLLPAGSVWKPLEDLLAIRPITAVAFLLSSLSLWFWSHRPISPSTRLAAQALGAIVFAIGLFGFIEQLASGHIRIMTLLQGDISGVFPGSAVSWLTPQAALAFIFLGLALVILDWRIHRYISPSEYCLFIVAAISFITLLRHTYDESFLSPDPQVNYMMKLSTAFILILLSWGGLCACTKGGMMLVLLSPLRTARALRRILLLVAIALPVLGWAQLEQGRRGWHPPEFGVALLVVSSLSVFSLAVLILGAGLIKAEIFQRRAEQNRWIRDSYFSTTFQQAAVGLAHVSASGRFLLTNPSLSAILGYSAKEFKAMTFQGISLPDDLQSDLELLNRALAGEFQQYTVDKRYYHKNGSIVWAHITATLLRNRDGKPKYFVTVIEDITEFKRIHHELEAASKAKDHFLSIISHELRTPLTPVLAALTSNGGPNNHHSTPDLSNPAIVEMLRRNIEHEASIINDLLDLTRISSSALLKLELKPVDLHRLIREVFEGIATSLEKKKITGTLQLEAPRSTVMGDVTRLRQILLNLLDNAMKFTPDGGAITIHSFLRELPSASPLAKAETDLPRKEELCVTIADTGEGIDPEQLEAIFNPFEQGKRNRERGLGGLGLGLAIVKGFIEAHGGHIAAKNKGKGAEFTFTLPLTDQSEAPAPPADAAGTPHSSQPVRILLVEDHHDTRITLKRLLERRGNKVRTAGTAEEAVQLAVQHPADLLISDIGLPNGSGLDIPAALRTRGVDIPGIALSGFGSEEDTRKSLQAGFALHLTKPVEMAVLEQAIAELALHEGPPEHD